MDDKNLAAKKAADILLATLSEWKDNARSNFSKYVNQIYTSKIQDKFSSLLTPCPKGIFVKVSDINYRDDSEHIDLYQEVQIRNSSHKGFLFSMIDTSLMPIEITQSRKLSDNTINLTFGGDKIFTLAKQKLIFWIHPRLNNLKKGLHIFKSLNHCAKLSYINEAGEKKSLQINLELGNNDFQKANMLIKNNLYDPRFQFRICIDLSSIREISFRKIDLELHIDNISMEDTELKNYFYTNIIPVINQNITNISPFKLDGNDDIYWLKAETDLAYDTYELRGLFSNKRLLDPSVYRVINRKKILGVEFNELKEYLNTNITGVICVEYKLDSSLYDTDVSLKWYGHNINKYSLSAISCINNQIINLDFTTIKSLVSLLDIAKIKHWSIDIWRNLFSFFDIFSYFKISELLHLVDVIGNDIILTFVPSQLSEQLWINYYIEQVEYFLSYNMSYLDFKIIIRF